jgi:hypothetical protein
MSANAVLDSVCIYFVSLFFFVGFISVFCFFSKGSSQQKGYVEDTS